MSFDPRDLGNLAVWLDAMSYQSFSDDESGGVFSGTTPGLWRDNSGNSNDAKQANSANRPTYNATGLNSLPSVVDASSDFLTILDAASLDYTTFSCFVVLQRDTDAGATQGVFGKSIAFNNKSEFTLIINSSDSFQMRTTTDGNDAGTGVSTLPQTDNVVGEPDIVDFGYNGTLQTTAKTGLGIEPNIQGTIFQDTAPMEVFRAFSATLQGRISEILFFNSILSTINRQKMLDYLSAKWSIS